MQKLLFESPTNIHENQQSTDSFQEQLREFKWKHKNTAVSTTNALIANASFIAVETFTNEFWTSKQRDAHSLHEISYRACFKPQLPAFFIERLTEPGGVVYDPFMGRGTTVLEAAILGRTPAGNDANPLSRILVEPRLDPPAMAEIEGRLRETDFGNGAGMRGSDVGEGLPRSRNKPNAPPEAWHEIIDGVPVADLLVFYHPDTLREIVALRAHLSRREKRAEADRADRWIRMVATNRLTGHSPGFFSVYTLPPNQAVSAESQRKINRDRKQAPPYRNVPALILKKSRALLKDCQEANAGEMAPDVCDGDLNRARARGGGSALPPGLRASDGRYTNTWRSPALRQVGAVRTPAPRPSCSSAPGLRGASPPLLLSRPADSTSELPSDSVDLVVTSPPFLDVVDYKTDNWLRCWFNGIDPAAVRLTMAKRLEDWQTAMTRVFRELRRVLKKGGHVAFEVGEVRAGRLKLEEAVLPCGAAAGLSPVCVVVNAQRFTKTANCWGVSNNAKGTNSNRIVVFRKA